MNLLASTYFPMPMPMPIIITGDGGDGGNVSNLPPYASGILIAAIVVGIVFLFCLCLSLIFDTFDRELVSDVFLKSAMILLTLSVALIGIAILCALIGV